MHIMEFIHLTKALLMVAAFMVAVSSMRSGTAESDMLVDVIGSRAKNSTEKSSFKRMMMLRTSPPRKWLI